VIFALNGLVVGILNANDRFAAAALAPIAWNMVILAALAAGLAFVPRHDVIYYYALGVVVGTLVQFVIPLPQLRGLGGTLRPHANLRDPRVRQVLLLMLPVTISLGLINLQQLIDTLISTRVPDHWFHAAGVKIDAGPSILDKAFRLYMLPQGIFSVAISTIVFPVLARFAAPRRRRRLSRAFLTRHAPDIAHADPVDYLPADLRRARGAGALPARQVRP